MQKSRRRYPRARADIRFQPGTGGFSLHDAQGVRANPVSFMAALVFTYCDGHHPPDVIADSVAGAANPRSNAEELRAEVRRIIQNFTEAGLVN